MPNPCRKARLSGAISRLVCNVRSKRPDSSQLVVQTGFPTSLADIVVKNRSRLRMSKRHSTPAGSFGCKVSNVISAAQPRDDHCALPTALDLAGVDVDVDVDVAREGEADPTHDRDGTRLLPVLSHGEELPATAPPPRLRPAAGAGMAWSKLAVAVMVLAACSVSASKVFVLGITIATIAILLIESIATRVFATFTGDVREFGPLCGSELEVDKDSDRRRYSPGHVKEDKGSNSESSRKESVARGFDGIRMEGPSEKAGEDAGDDEDNNYNYNNDDDDEVDNDDDHSSSKEAITMNKDQKMACPKYLVLVVIVLSGLIGGRIVALGSTVAWWYLAKLARDGWFFKARR